MFVSVMYFYWIVDLGYVSMTRNKIHSISCVWTLLWTTTFAANMKLGLHGAAAALIFDTRTTNGYRTTRVSQLLTLLWLLSNSVNNSLSASARRFAKRSYWNSVAHHRKKKISIILPCHITFFLAAFEPFGRGEESTSAIWTSIFQIRPERNQPKTDNAIR